MQQTTYLVEASSLLLNNRLTDGLAYFFGDALTHLTLGTYPNTTSFGVKIERPDYSEQTELPKGMHQWIDRADLSEYEAKEIATDMALSPYSDGLALLTPTATTTVDGITLREGVVGSVGERQYFQHPFIFAHDDGEVPITLGDDLVVSDSITGVPSHVQAKQIWKQTAANRQEILFHSLQVSGSFTSYASDTLFSKLGISASFYAPTQISNVIFTGPDVVNIQSTVHADGTTGIRLGDHIKIGDYIGKVITIGTPSSTSWTIQTKLATHNGDAYGAGRPPQNIGKWGLYHSTMVSVTFKLPVYSYKFTSVTEHRNEAYAAGTPDDPLIRFLSVGSTVDGIGDVVESVPILKSIVHGEDDIRTKLCTHKLRTTSPVPGRCLYTQKGNNVGDVTQTYALIRAQKGGSVGTNVLEIEYIRPASQGYHVRRLVKSGTSLLIYIDSDDFVYGVLETVHLSGELLSTDPETSVYALLKAQESLSVTLVTNGDTGINNVLHTTLSGLSAALPDFDYVISVPSASNIRVGTDAPNPYIVIGYLELPQESDDLIGPHTYQVATQEIVAVSATSATVQVNVSDVVLTPFDYTGLGAGNYVHKTSTPLYIAIIYQMALYKGIHEITDEEALSINEVNGIYPIPKGTVIMYAGGSVCPPGYKRLEKPVAGFETIEVPVPDNVEIVGDGTSRLSWDASQPSLYSAGIYDEISSAKQIVIAGRTAPAIVKVPAVRQDFQPGMTLSVLEAYDKKSDRRRQYFIKDIEFDNELLSGTKESAKAYRNPLYTGTPSVYGQGGYGNGGAGSITYPQIQQAEFTHPAIAAGTAWTGFPGSLSTSGALNTYGDVFPAGPDIKYQTLTFPTVTNGMMVLKTKNLIDDTNKPNAYLDCRATFVVPTPNVTFIDGNTLNISSSNSINALTGGNKVKSGDVFFFEFYAYQNSSTSYRFVDAFLGVVERQSDEDWRIYRYDQRSIELHGFNTAAFPEENAGGYLNTGTSSPGFVRFRPAMLYGMPGTPQVMGNCIPYPGQTPRGQGAAQSATTLDDNSWVWINSLSNPSPTITVDKELEIPAGLTTLLLEATGYLKSAAAPAVDYGKGPHSHKVLETDNPGQPDIVPEIRIDVLTADLSAHNDTFIAQYKGPYALPSGHTHGTLPPTFTNPYGLGCLLCEKI